MIRTSTLRQIVYVAFAVSLLVGACARRPVVPVASAPPPTGETRAVTPPPPAPAPPPAAMTPAPPPPQMAAPPSAPAPAPAPAQVTAAPAPAPTPPKEFRAHDALKPIYFDFDKSNIRPGDAKILDANAAWIRDNSGYLVLIEGHCDERGTNEYNLALGDRRAKAAMNYLQAQGVNADRMMIVSYGEERPVCNDHAESCWSKNRRDQFLVKER
ncbi:MAG TPA: peptidoglycan-associated lipoprotein Pal [Methylomirabilota bacterium]|jgi:peptidoglycan-associated lipoprotein